jgi:hypothetical protein
MNPVDAHLPDNHEKVKAEYDKRYISQQTPKFEVGDLVRLYKYKDTFEKKSGKRFTDELFMIKYVDKNSYPIVYIIEDLEGNEIKGKVNQWEMVKHTLVDVEK